MRPFFLRISVLLLLVASLDAHADSKMVLVVSAESEIENVSSIDLRKLFLGFTVNDAQGRPIRAITNISDDRLWDIFLQNIMGMSERSYDRRLLTLTLQSGRPRPPVASNLESALLHIVTDSNAISFVWLEDIEGRQDVRVLRLLWQP